MNSFKRADPYPFPKNIVKNKKYAQILKASYSGNVSELTAVMQYIYHHIKLTNKDTEIAHDLEKIAIVEMHHFDMLGQLIGDLGGEPIYTKKTGVFETYWDASAVLYGNSAEEMIRFDLNSEQEAIVNYKKTVQAIEDEEIQALIEAIIEDEEIHLKWFENTYNNLIAL